MHRQRLRSGRSRPAAAKHAEIGASISKRWQSIAAKRMASSERRIHSGARGVGGRPKAAGGRTEENVPPGPLKNLAEAEPELVAGVLRASVERDGEVDPEQAEPGRVAQAHTDRMAERE